MKHNILSISLILVLGVIVYSNTFQNSFHFDDFPQIVENIRIRDISNIQLIADNLITRFVAYYSFALNYHWNGLNVEGYHIFSLALHLLCAVLVWWLCRLTISFPIFQDPGITPHQRWIALFAGLLFAVHPIQTEPVNYIFQRAVLWTVFFYLLTLIFFIKAREFWEHKNSVVAVFCYALSLLSALLCTFSKELSISLPFLILFYVLFVIKEKRSWPVILPYVGIAALIPIMNHGLNIWNISDVSTGDYFLTQLRVKFTYLRLLFFPFHQSILYDYPLARSFFDPAVLASIGGLIFLIVLIFRLKSTWPIISFALTWFFITILPESSFIPINNLVCEYRLYLPMVAFSIFLPFIIFQLCSKFSLAVRMLSIIVIVFAVLAYQRNGVWLNEFTLWDDAVHKAPLNKFGYQNRGAYYHNHGELDKALADYNMVIGLGPVTAVTLSNRGLIFKQKGMYDLAMANFNLAIDVNPAYAGTYINRGNLYVLLKEYGLALNDFKSVSKLLPNDPGVYWNMALIYSTQGDTDQCRINLQKAVDLGASGVLSCEKSP